MNKKKDVLLTPEGYKKLKNRYEELTSSERKAIAQRISEAREQGDLSENAAYKSAKEDQEFLEREIQDLEETLNNAKVVDKAEDCDEVSLGCTVTVEVDGEELEFKLVGGVEADPSEGRISYCAPLGKALCGKSVGEAAMVQTPAGEMVYKIKDIS
ncbi:MAG: transcription elongation factor GreA [Patescibacteria group bacterium]